MRHIVGLGKSHVLVFALIILVCIAAAAASTEVILLKSPGCTKCAAAEKLLNGMADEEDLNITSYYYYTDEGHRIIKERRVKGDIPAIVIGNQSISYKDYKGDEAKLERFIRGALANQSGNGGIIQNAAQNAVQYNDNDSLNNQTNQTIHLNGEADLGKMSFSTLSAVLAAGLVAGFNPCLLGILVFLSASVLSSSGRRRELLMMVVFFSLGIFTMYFLFGLGMQRLLQTEAIFSAFRYAVTAFLIIVGMAHVLDAVKLSRGGESLFRTDWALKYFRAGVSNGRLSSYFLLGALFSLVKAPCVGAVYLAILDLISAKSYFEGTVYLLFYNLGIILPIIVLGGLMALGMSPEKVDAFRKDYRVGIRLVTGLALLALAPLIYWQII
jgi:cytochrome c-type biogenesis protein